MAELLECLFSCDLKKLKTIFEKIDVNFEIPGTDGCTPLHVVAGMESVAGKEHVLALLLEMGADPNARSFENLTPVHIASMWDNCYELEKLLQHGGNPWLTDNENKNSFDMAADNRAYRAFQLLNIYLAEDKLNFKSARREPKSPNKPAADFPECVGGETAEDSKLVSNSAFMTANENFPVILSSNDEESDDLVLNMSKFLKRKSTSKNKQKKQTQKLVNFDFSDSTITEESEKHADILAKSTDNENDVTKKNSKNNLNNAYLFSSSESETSDVLAPNLNNSNDSSNETIIEGFDNSGIVLVETKNSDNKMYTSDTSISSIGSDWKSYHGVNNDCSTSSYCSSHSKSSIIISEELQQYSNSKIFEELKHLGDNPGPVLGHTRQVYLQRLARLKSGCWVSCELPKPKYCPEVYLFLENKLDMTRAKTLEQDIATEFDADSGQKWREGNQKCCFNYFLLDPRVTQNLPARILNLTKEQRFLTFLDSLFYVGKGTRGRPYMHLFEAAKSMVSGTPKNDKINHILEIWEAGLGVISLHCFHNSIPVEAYTKEACIIEAIGIENLTNIKKGDFYGSCARLTTARKRLIGISLLERALQIFLLEGERQIKPKDIQKK